MNESNIAGISVRAIIVLFLVLIFAITVFFTSLKNDALNSMVMAAVGWYFGQKSSQVSNSSVESSNNTPPKIS